MSFVRRSLLSLLVETRDENKRRRVLPRRTHLPPSNLLVRAASKGTVSCFHFEGTSPYLSSLTASVHARSLIDPEAGLRRDLKINTRGNKIARALALDVILG